MIFAPALMGEVWLEKLIRFLGLVWGTEEWGSGLGFGFGFEDEMWGGVDGWIREGEGDGKAEDFLRMKRG